MKILIATDLVSDLSMYNIPMDFNLELGSNISFVSIYSKDFEFFASSIEIYFGNHLTEEVLLKLPRLNWIHLGSAGLDRVIKLKSLISPSIIISNSKGIMSKAVSLHTLSCILASCRGLFSSHDLFNKGILSRKSFDVNFPYMSDGLDLKVLIAGRGEISTQLMDWLKILGAEVDQFGRNQLKDKNIDWSKYEYIINILPFDINFKHFFDKSIFSNLMTGAVFISVGRGFVVNELDLFYFVKNGKIRMAYLDVFENEPFIATEYSNLENKIIFTPHVGGMFRNYWDSQLKLFKNNLNKFLSGEEILNKVNL
jgi:phosphoglycerate dehydrogenase-like enzyme